MNATLELLNSHRSIRSFKKDPIDEERLASIIEAAYRGPTSMNAQEISLVVVQDAVKRAKIAEIAGGQPWIAVAPVFILALVDFYKTSKGVEMAGRRQVIHGDPEGLVAATFDAGIALTNLMIAARSLGLGIVPIGGIRQNPEAMIELLHLPPMTFPVCGVCIGAIEKDAPLKPRLPLSTFRHDETYHEEGFTEAFTAYDQELLAYWQKIGRPEGLSWTANTSEKYQVHYYPNVKPVLQKQGFLKDV